MVRMADDANSGEDAGFSDDERLADLAAELADRIGDAIGPWVVRCVERIMVAWEGTCPRAVRDAAIEAAAEATSELVPAARELLATDVDQQRGNPLAILRSAVRFPTRVLRDAGVPGVVRDAEAERQFPDDDYDLTPASFAEIDPALHEPGMAWGAAKAHVVLRRRRAEGRT
jgi:hypothetical protein